MVGRRTNSNYKFDNTIYFLDLVCAQPNETPNAQSTPPIYTPLYTIILSPLDLLRGHYNLEPRYASFRKKWVFGHGAIIWA